jgi:hypothetical protein
MYSALDLIKPKRLYEDKKAILADGFICLDLGDTKIYKECQTKFPLSEISIKDLYTGEYDNANRLDVFDFTLPELKYEEIAINVNDTVYFSSVSSTGEDIYFCGSLDFTENVMSCWASGLVFLNHYTSYKIKFSHSFDHYIDYQVFYYIFQMFKNLSGKKLDYLCVAKQDGILYMTNPNRDFHIISKEPCKFKTESFEKINKFYNNQIATQTFRRTVDIDKKSFVEGKDSFIKHLSRPLEEKFNHSENNTLEILSSKDYQLCINKVK